MSQVTSLMPSWGYGLFPMSWLTHDGYNSGSLGTCTQAHRQQDWRRPNGPREWSGTRWWMISCRNLLSGICYPVHDPADLCQKFWEPVRPFNGTHFHNFLHEKAHFPRPQEFMPKTSIIQFFYVPQETTPWGNFRIWFIFTNLILN
jgi:hypothetical protein